MRGRNFYWINIIQLLNEAQNLHQNNIRRTLVYNVQVLVNVKSCVMEYMPQ